MGESRYFHPWNSASSCPLILARHPHNEGPSGTPVARKSALHRSRYRFPQGRKWVWIVRSVTTVLSSMPQSAAARAATATRRTRCVELAGTGKTYEQIAAEVDSANKSSAAQRSWPLLLPAKQTPSTIYAVWRWVALTNCKPRRGRRPSPVMLEPSTECCASSRCGPSCWESWMPHSSGKVVRGNIL